MAVKSFFDLLKPADKLAIETTMKTTKKEDLEHAYKEYEARKASRYDSDIELILIFLTIFLIAAFALAVIFTFQMQATVKGLARVSPDLCRAHNATFEAFLPAEWWSNEIVCSNSVDIKIP